MLWKAKYSLLANTKETIVWGKVWIKVLRHCRFFTRPTSFGLGCFFVLVLTLKPFYLFLLKLCCTHPYCFTMKQFKTKKDSNHGSEVLTSHYMFAVSISHTGILLVTDFFQENRIQLLPLLWTCRIKRLKGTLGGEYCVYRGGLVWKTASP